VARRLVPVLTQSSFRVRGFALTCFGLDAAQRAPALGPAGVDKAFLRFERLVVYAQCGHYRDEGKLPEYVRYAGTRRAYARLRSSTDLDLSSALLLHDDLSGGLWGAYRRPALHLGLLRGKWNRTNPAATGVAPLGVSLANTLETTAVANPTSVRKLARDPTRSTTPEQAATLIPADTGRARPKESAVLSRAFGAYDDRCENEGRGRPFASLRAGFDRVDKMLTLDNLNASLLTEGQAQAFGDAVALADLMVALEVPYRRWVTGRNAALAKTVARRAAWARVRAMGEPELVELHDRLTADPSLEELHRHQDRIAAARGREPWVLGDPRLGREKTLPFDFTLGTVSRLFTEGVDPDSDA
jgi:hypothetical protein